MTSTSFIMIISGASPFPGHHGSPQRGQRRAGRSEKRAFSRTNQPPQHLSGQASGSFIRSRLPLSAFKTQNGIHVIPLPAQPHAAAGNQPQTAPMAVFRLKNFIHSFLRRRVPTGFHITSVRIPHCIFPGFQLADAHQTPSPPWASGNGRPNARNPFPP